MIASDRIKKHIEVVKELLEDENSINLIEDIAWDIINCYRKGGKVLFCGNGGSAADAQHLAAELSGKFYKVRDPLFAEALHANTSFLTAVANDFGYDVVFQRAVQAKGNEGDVLIGMTTSGTSKNIKNAIIQAKYQKMMTICFTGNNNNLDGICHELIKAPSNDVARIQEVHMLVGHIICEIVEDKLF